MVVLTQLFYVWPGKEALFEEYEAKVLPLLEKYGGELVLRVRPTVLGGTAEAPTELHIVRFPDEAAIARYGDDVERRRHLHLKEEAVRTVLSWKGAAV